MKINVKQFCRERIFWYNFSMTTEDRLDLIKQVGEEIVKEDELKKLLESGEKLIAYDGFEPSGQMHIAQGIVRAININKMIKAGVKFKMLVADWHAMANNKMGGDLEKIKIVGKYFIEVWRASGMDLKNVEFVWASDLVQKQDYWKLVIQVGRSNALRRFVRTAEMMGREESLDKLTGAHIIYSCMQVADIFMLGAEITQLGMDQRKVNMLAREVGPMLGFWKPVVVSHHMLMGLQKYQDQKSNIKNQNDISNIKNNNETMKQSNNKIARTIALKMSKSNPDSAIFMTDTTEDIKRKINKAYCPEGDTKENPILEYYKYIVFDSLDKLQINELRIERSEKFGGNISFKTYQELEKTFAEKQVHPMDLKATLSKLLDQLIEPVRRHFEENAEAKKLLEQVQSFQVTR
jgi:tyrosyl-tRNA synthetase